jgi:hypothetical protein
VKIMAAAEPKPDDYDPEDNEDQSASIEVGDLVEVPEVSLVRGSHLAII